MVLTEAGRKCIKNYMVNIQENAEKDKILKTLLNLLSLPVIEGKKYYYGSEFVVFFTEQARVSIWDYYKRNMIDVEFFFGVILYLVDKEKWTTLKEEHKLHELSALYEALGLSEYIKKELFHNYFATNATAYERVFTIWYTARYIDSTELETIRDNNKDYEAMLEALISVYVDMIQKYYKELYVKLDGIFVEKSINLSAYCQKVVNDYRIEHVDLKWKRKQNNFYSDMYDIGTSEDELLLTSKLPDKEHLIKLIGNAGAGKTTALKFLQHRACEKYLSAVDKNGITVPVYVELRSAGECLVEGECGEELLKRMIKRALGIENENMDIAPILKSGRISIYLDGYNEVSQNKKIGKDVLREKVCSGIKSLSETKEYEKLCIIVSDRADETLPVYWFKSSNPYALFQCIPLEDNEIVPYFEKKFSGSENEKYLTRVKCALDKVSGDLKWLYGQKVIPFMLEQVIEMVKVFVDNGINKSFPEEHKFDFIYLKSILEREESQKTEEGDTEDLIKFRKWLREQAKIGRTISDETAIRGSKLYDESVCVKLYQKAIQIHIMEKVVVEENGKEIEKESVKFVNDNYRTFCSTCINAEGNIILRG